jgi:hypothetical protein
MYLIASAFKFSAGSQLHNHIGQPFHFTQYSTPWQYEERYIINFKLKFFSGEDELLAILSSYI